MGGLSANSVSKEWKRLFNSAHLATTARPYDLRGSISTELNAAELSHLMQRYVTGHATSDIMNRYVSLDAQREMRPYFDTLAPLMEAVRRRGQELRLLPSDPSVSEGRRRMLRRAV
jgi:hypothetical protein